MATDDDEPHSGLADAAGRAAFFPARAAARAWRGPLEEVVDEVLSAPEIARVIDRALAGPQPRTRTHCRRACRERRAGAPRDRRTGQPADGRADRPSAVERRDAT